MTFQDLNEVFLSPPLTDNQHQSYDNHIKKTFIKTKPYPTQELKGMSKCGRVCTLTHYINMEKQVLTNIKQTHKLPELQCKIYVRKKLQTNIHRRNRNNPTF